MNLQMNTAALSLYHARSQAVRVMTEGWVGENLYCPECGHASLSHFPNNRPVADFFCADCGREYELKSGGGAVGRKITDGAYGTMMERITGGGHPGLFVMRYSPVEWQVRDLILVPGHFFVPAIIEKRAPLAASARRAGWIGCNILFSDIPMQGRIPIIAGGAPVPKESVLAQANAAELLALGDVSGRGWLMDVLNCVNRVPSREFTLGEMYAFEAWLRDRHPKNENIRPKIRQQLQLLRDKGFIEFLGRGMYRKTQPPALQA